MRVAPSLRTRARGVERARRRRDVLFDVIVHLALVIARAGRSFLGFFLAKAILGAGARDDVDATGTGAASRERRARARDARAEAWIRRAKRHLGRSRETRAMQ